VPTNSSGTAGFATLAITGPGTYTITFSATGLTGATSGSIIVGPFLGDEYQIDGGDLSLVFDSPRAVRRVTDLGGTPRSRVNTLGLNERRYLWPGAATDPKSAAGRNRAVSNTFRMTH
jgi:hypothetical protein